MTHRTFTISGNVFNVFDSHAGAQRFITSQPGDYSVIVRRRLYAARRGDTMLTINLAGDVDPRQAHIMDAWRALSGEIEKMIAAEKAAA